MHKKRLQALQKTLLQHNVDMLFIDDPINLYYLTGIILSAGRLCIPAHGEPLLLVDGRYIAQCKQQSPFPVSLTQNSPIENLLTSVKNLGFDSSRTTYQAYQTLKKLTESFNQLSLTPIENPLNPIRGIKDDAEIQILREAADLGSRGFDFVCSLLKEGVTEKELAVELEIFWKRRGGEKLAFDSIIAFGANSAMPHYRAGTARLQKGHTVLIDIGVGYQHYHSDMTRTLFFGPLDPKMLEIYGIVKEAQERALALCKPGQLIGNIDKAARDFIAEKGYGAAFSHGLGHGVGLEIHEYPILKNVPPYQCLPLEKGMVITIEPGIYLEGLGGVRIENTIVITATGYEDLTKRSTDLP